MYSNINTFTNKNIIDALKKSQRDNNAHIMIAIREFTVSIGYGYHYYASKGPLSSIDENSDIYLEIALFKSGDWITPNNAKDIIGDFKWINLWEPVSTGCRTSVAPHVPINVVCEIMNFLKGIKTQTTVKQEHSKGKCRRCGAYDEYINDGELCYRCIG